MWTDRVRVLHDTSPGDWVPPRLEGGWAQVTGLVPAGYEAYVRILHPADAPVTDAAGTVTGARPVRWSEVAAVTGERLHPLVRWHELVHAADPWNPDSALWPHGQPAWGDLDLVQLDALTRLLAGHTGTPERCLFALWEGWGSLNGSSAVLTAGPAGTSTRPLPRAFTDAEWAAPRLALPDRTYLLLAGPLDSARTVAEHAPGGFPGTQSPQLVWPEDRAWCVATEIDLDSTVVGGTRAVVDAVLADPGLEAWEVRAGDSLAFA
jgi:hypothetical protein